jgi:predicted peptidase
MHCKTLKCQWGVVVVFLGILVGALNAEEKKPVIDSNDPLMKLFEPREYVDESGKSLNYRLMKPIDYKPSKTYPLVIFLHGAGERGDDNISQLVHAAREFADEERRRAYPAYVLFPQCPKEKKWVNVDWNQESHTLPDQPSESMALVKALVDEMIESAGIDDTRIYITGLSMGGFGTWDAIARYENFFAAAAPICGGGDPATASRFVDLPIWCFHGTKDRVVKFHRTQEMVDALKKLGGDPKFTEYPDVEHNSWTPTYANPALYEWMFAQVRP